MTISGLIFDMDGTLVDSVGDIADSVNLALKALKLPQKNIETVRQYVGDGMKTLLIRSTGTDDEKTIARAIDVFYPAYLENCTKRTILYPGTHQTLEHFKNLPLGLISNKPQAMAEKILEHFKISKYFKAILGAEAAPNKKPHPEPIHKALHLMKVKAESVLIVGDGVTDIQAGIAAGVKTCAVTYGYKSRKELEAEKPDFIIDKIEELRSIPWH